MDPIVRERPLSATPAKSTPTPTPTTTRKPLVVLVAAPDDNVVALYAILSNRYRVREYASAEQAWASLQLDGDADAVICSQVLPRMSGLDLAARIRKAGAKALRELPIVVVGATIDNVLRQRAVRGRIDRLAAWDRPFVDLGAWLDERLLASSSSTEKASRTDALRQWAHRHLRLDVKTRESLIVFRVASDGIGVLSERLGRVIRRPEMLLADSLNCVWLSIDTPISTAAKFAMRLAHSVLPESDRERVRLIITYAPMLQLADETYDALKALAGTEPPPGHLELATHHWRFALPFDAVKLLMR